MLVTINVCVMSLLDKVCHINKLESVVLCDMVWVSRFYTYIQIAGLLFVKKI